MAPLTEAGVQVDHAESFGWADQFGKVLFQPAVRPRRPRSTMKDAGRVVVLPAAHNLLEAVEPDLASHSKERARRSCLYVLGPQLRHDQVGHVAVRLVRRR